MLSGNLAGIRKYNRRSADSSGKNVTPSCSGRRGALRRVTQSYIGYVGPGYPRARLLGGMSMRACRPLPTETSASNESFARGGTAPPSDEWCAARLPPSGWPANPVLEYRLSRLQLSCGRPPRMSRAPGGGRRPPRMRGAPAPLPSALLCACVCVWWWCASSEAEAEAAATRSEKEAHLSHTHTRSNTNQQ